MMYLFIISNKLIMLELAVVRAYDRAALHCNVLLLNKFHVVSLDENPITILTTYKF